MKTRFLPILLGTIFGIMISGTGVTLAANVTVTRSTQPVYVDGKQVILEAYAINGHNYVQLRDVGRLLDVNVYWDGANVQMDTNSSYTGEAPASTQPIQTFVPPAQATPAVSPTAYNIEVQRQEIIDRTNAVRAERGLAPVRADPMLMKAAQIRADEMAATTTYSHTRPDGSFCKTVTDCTHISENIHRIVCDFIDQRGISVAEFAIRGWTCSEGHLRNILQDGMSGIGVGLALGINDYGEPSWYCVQQFIRGGYTITWVDTPKLP